MDNKKIKYPVYIVSKGRSYNPSTARNFLKWNVPFKMVIEPQEYNDYLKVIPENYIAILPFSNLKLGSYPARNWCWEHSIKNGYSRHHIFDDNIPSFGKFSGGIKTFIGCNPFEAMNVLECFTEKFSNIAISGFNYGGFVTKSVTKPFYLNTHVYSGMLINNNIPFRWRLKYNEDVDLCLQALHNKWCTILLNAFLIGKRSTTEKHPGGNQDELYRNNDPKKKLLKSRSLEMIWPQYVKTVIKFGRPHHQVSWNKFFKHPLKKIL